MCSPKADVIIYPVAKAQTLLKLIFIKMGEIVEAKKCRLTSTLSASQRIQRLTGIIVPPNSEGGCLALFKLR